jgi:hypothetical protein
LKSYPGDFGGGGKSVTRTPLKIVNDDYIKNIKCKCYNRNYLSWLLFIPTPMEWTGGLRARPIPPATCIMV